MIVLRAYARRGSVRSVGIAVLLTAAGAWGCFDGAEQDSSGASDGCRAACRILLECTFGTPDAVGECTQACIKNLKTSTEACVRATSDFGTCARSAATCAELSSSCRVEFDASTSACTAPADGGTDARPDGGADVHADGNGGSDSGIEPGEYGPCSSEGACGGSAVCLPPMGGGTACAPRCETSADCPTDDIGATAAGCYSVDDGLGRGTQIRVCILMCDEGSDQCPDGGICVDAGGPRGSCVWDRSAPPDECAGAAMRECGGVCVDTLTDPGNCGGCGAAFACARPKVCTDGTCRCPDTAPDLCGETCVNTASSALHCGACDRECPARTGTYRTCAAGECRYACRETLASCDGDEINGCEVNLQTDPAHCGACDHPCPARPNMASACAAGDCSYACAIGYADCNAVPEDGCEVNLQTDLAQCGTCGHACAARPNMAASCVAGGCGYACVRGYTDCNGVPEDGCEVNWAADVQNCGACMRSCPDGLNADTICLDGECRFACLGSYANCDLAFDSGGTMYDPTPGCETDTSSNVAHCGACRHYCPVQEICCAGECTGGACL